MGELEGWGHQVKGETRRGGGGALEEQECGLGHFEFEMSVRHPSGDIR